MQHVTCWLHRGAGVCHFGEYVFKCERPVWTICFHPHGTTSDTNSHVINIRSGPFTLFTFVSYCYLPRSFVFEQKSPKSVIFVTTKRHLCSHKTLFLVGCWFCYNPMDHVPRVVHPRFTLLITLTNKPANQPTYKSDGDENKLCKKLKDELYFKFSKSDLKSFSRLIFLKCDWFLN